jgi:hypothetical protein
MQTRKKISPLRRRLPAYWLFFDGSLDGLEDELEPDGLDDELELDGLEDEPVAPLPEDDLSLDELESLEDGGVALLLLPEPLDDGGVALLLLPELDGVDGELIEPEDEPLLDGDDGDVAEPLELAPGRLDDAPLEPAPLEPRSQPAKAVPSATDTATARIESFMLPP